MDLDIEILSRDSISEKKEKSYLLTSKYSQPYLQVSSQHISIAKYISLFVLVKSKLLISQLISKSHLKIRKVCTN
jgi:hypothetical protein